jgi:hypothetical protein
MGIREHKKLYANKYDEMRRLLEKQRMKKQGGRRPAAGESA